MSRNHPSKCDVISNRRHQPLILIGMLTLPAGLSGHETLRGRDLHVAGDRVSTAVNRVKFL